MGQSRKDETKKEVKAKAPVAVKQKLEESESKTRNISQPLKANTNVLDKKPEVPRKEQEVRGGVMGFFGGGKAKEKIAAVEETKKAEVSRSTNEKATKAEIETKSNIIGFFKSGKNKEDKTENQEKSSVFSFFGRTSNKEEQSRENEKREEIQKVTVTNINKPKTISMEAQKMSVITTFRGAEPKPRKHSDELPDLEAADVAAATLKIQSAYKGFKTRQMIKKHKEVLPDLNCAQVQDATIKIQSAYRGFKTRKQMRKRDDSMSDLEAADVAAATIKIQSAYKGFRVRKEIKQQEELR